MSKIINSDRAVIIKSRAVIYRFLSVCYYYPSPELFDIFTSNIIGEITAIGKHLNIGSFDEITESVNWLAQWSNQERAICELEKEYTRLFITSFSGVIASPYSSVYISSDNEDSSQKGRVWGVSTAKAIKFYEAAGLNIAEDFHDIPDHIAVEFEFFSFILNEQLNDSSIEGARVKKFATIEKEFLVEHLFTWAPLFLSHIIENKFSCFYGNVAQFTQRFLEDEINRVTSPL